MRIMYFILLYPCTVKTLYYYYDLSNDKSCCLVGFDPSLFLYEVPLKSLN